MSVHLFDGYLITHSKRVIRDNRVDTKCRKIENALGPECSHLDDPNHTHLNQKIVFIMPTAGGQVRCQTSLNLVGTRVIEMYMVIVLIESQIEI